MKKKSVEGVVGIYTRMSRGKRQTDRLNTCTPDSASEEEGWKAFTCERMMPGL